MPSILLLSSISLHYRAEQIPSEWYRLEFVGDKDHGPAQAETRRDLFEARERRAHPDRDEKVPTA